MLAKLIYQTKRFLTVKHIEIKLNFVLLVTILKVYYNNCIAYAVGELVKKHLIAVIYYSLFHWSRFNFLP